MSSFLDTINAEIAECWQWRMDTDPELAAALGFLDKRRSTHALDPRSPSSFEDRLAYMKEALARFQALLETGSVESLSESKRLSVDLYVDQLETYVANSKYRTYLCCLNRMEGPQTDLPLYASYLPLKTPADCAFYKAFLAASSVQIDEGEGRRGTRDANKYAQKPSLTFCSPPQ
jgi:uncharacterized protein (DUF885 family)